jgi:hypothetical protein
LIVSVGDLKRPATSLKGTWIVSDVERRVDLIVVGWRKVAALLVEGIYVRPAPKLIPYIAGPLRKGSDCRPKGGLALLIGHLPRTGAGLTESIPYNWKPS